MEYEYMLQLTTEEVRRLHELIGMTEVNDGLDDLYVAFSEMVADANTWGN